MNGQMAGRLAKISAEWRGFNRLWRGSRPVAGHIASTYWQYSWNFRKQICRHIETFQNI
jgi:hypothetical protein